MDQFFADCTDTAAEGAVDASGIAGIRGMAAATQFGGSGGVYAQRAATPSWLLMPRALARRPHVESHFADGTLWLRPCGRFTFMECAAADAAFVAAGSDVRRVVATLDAVDCIDSSAAGLLLYMLDTLGERSVEVHGARAPVDAMLRRLCLDRVLTIRH